MTQTPPAQQSTLLQAVEQLRVVLGRVEGLLVLLRVLVPGEHDALAGEIALRVDVVVGALGLAHHLHLHRHRHDFLRRHLLHPVLNLLYVGRIVHPRHVDTV